MSAPCPPAPPPTLGHILDQLVPVADDLAARAHADDRALARLAAAVLQALGDLCLLSDHLATLAGVPDPDHAGAPGVQP